MIKSFIALCLALCASCVAYPPEPQEIEVGIIRKIDAPTSWSEDREKQVERLKYFEDRSVYILRDCSLKKGEKTGIKKPDTAFDGSGSGTVVSSKDGNSYIFTAAHVIGQPKILEKDKFQCTNTVYTGQTVDLTTPGMPAKIIAKDVDRDIAVLEVDENLGVDTNLESKPVLGEHVWAVGYPRVLADPSGDSRSITDGTISTLNVPVQGKPKKFGYYHRTSAEVYFGNSGGGLMNSEGSLVGVVVGLYAYDPPKESPLPYPNNYYVKPVGEVLTLLRKTGQYYRVFGD